MKQASSSTDARRRFAPFLALTVIGLVGLAVCFSGWEGAYDPFNIDHVGNRNNARALVDSGVLPVTAGLSNLGAYNPPGGSWYLVPSVFFEDIRVGERFSLFLLYLLTVIPMFLVSRRLAGTRTAMILVLLYTFSAPGLFFEGSVQYRARPFTYAWLLYFLLQWLETGRARHLFGAIVSLGFGLLIFWEMAPVIVGIAVAYWKFRPKIAWGPLFAGVAVVLLMWSPFLGFQIERDFVDFRASLISEVIWPDKVSTLQSYGDELGSWSTPDELGPFTPPKGFADEVSRPGPLKSALIKSVTIAAVFTSAFTAKHLWGPLPLGIALLFVVVVALHLYRIPDKILRSRLVGSFGVLFVFGALAVNEMVISMVIGRDLSGDEQSTIRLLQAGMAIAGLVILRRRSVVDWLTKTTMHLGFGGNSRPFPTNLVMMAYLTVPTWIVFSLLAYRPRLALGFWVWQWLLIGLLLVHCPRYFQLTRWVRISALVIAFALVLPNQTLSGHVRDWSQLGYSGEKSDAVVITDSLAEISKSMNLSDLRIGYLISFNGYELLWGLQDERFGGVGMALSHYLELQHGVSPVSPPPEGFSDGDDFRIVEVKNRKRSKYHRFVFADREKYLSIAQKGNFELFVLKSTKKRVENP